MDDDTRTGGRMTFVIAMLVALLLLMGAMLQAGGKPLFTVAVWNVAGLIFGLGALIGACVGFYNMGRMKGR